MVSVGDDVHFCILSLFGQFDRGWLIQKSNNIFLSINNSYGNFKLFRAKFICCSKWEMSFHSHIKHDHERVFCGSRPHEKMIIVVYELLAIFLRLPTMLHFPINIICKPFKDLTSTTQSSQLMGRYFVLVAEFVKG